MNKIFKMCEYGIPVELAKRLEKYDIEELKKIILNLTEITGLGNNRKEQILRILKSDRFKNESEDSVFELINYGFNYYDVNKLFKEGITIDNIRNEDVEKLKCSKQLKRKINIYKLNNNVGCNEKLLYEEIKKIISPFEEISINSLKNKLIEQGKYPIFSYLKDLNKLKKQNKIVMSSLGISYKVPCLMDEVEKIQKEKNRNIFIDRLKGYTYEEIGQRNNNLTRERVRQIIDRILKTLPTVKEDMYKSSFSRYDWSKEVFCNFYNEDITTYNYLGFKYIKGKEEISKILFEEELNPRQKEIIQKYYNCIEFYDEMVENKKDSILKVFAKNEAVDTIAFEELYEKYKKATNQLNIEKYIGLNNFEKSIVRKDYVLNGANRKIRYYNIDKIDLKDKLRLRDMLDCDVGEYSTLYFFNLYNEFMQELDIRNEYELHNLIRILDIKFKDKKITLEKMPNILIGVTNKHDFFEEHLKELTPNSVENVVEYFVKEFGHKKETISSYIRKEFKEYINNDEICFEVNKLDVEQINKIKEKMTSDLYLKSTAKKIFEMIIGMDYEKYYNRYNLNLIGYKIKEGYLQKNSINNLRDYILDKISEKKIIEVSDIPLYKTNSIHNIIRECENRFDIIKINDNKFLNYKVLEKENITKQDIISYGERAKEIYLPGEFFTLKSFRKKNGECQLDEEGFEDYLYESLIFHTEKIKKFLFDSNCVFYISSTKERHEFCSKDLIKEIIEKNGNMYMNEIIEKLNEEYSIETRNKGLIKELARQNKYYYSDIFDKIYKNKIEYLNEVYKED